MITALSIGQGGLGRFGNQLFTIAGVIGTARKSGQPFAFPHWKNYDNAIFGCEVTDFETVFANPLPRIPEGWSWNQYGYFWEYRELYLPTENWTIDAHMQSIKFFEHCIDEVRHYFTFKEEYPQRNDTCIHVRCGDYINDPAAYHPVCSKEYYLEAVNQFPENEFFNVFSDNPDFAYNMFCEILPKDRFFVEAGNDYISDFKLMKSFKSFVCANSSFSHMAALLGTHPEKKMIFPRRWFGSQAGGLNFDTLYPPNSIVI